MVYLDNFLFSWYNVFMSNRNQLIKDLTNILSKRSDDYLLGHYDALLEVRDDFFMDSVSWKTLDIMIDLLESVLSDRGLI